MQIMLEDSEALHFRKVYNILDLVGEVGGIQGFCVLVLAFVINPFSSLTYNLNLV
jgi:hypothetical protein